MIFVLARSDPAKCIHDDVLVYHEIYNLYFNAYEDVLARLSMSLAASVSNSIDWQTRNEESYDPTSFSFFGNLRALGDTISGVFPV